VTTAVRLLSVSEVAACYGISKGHVHLLAHRKQWQRVKWQGRVYYHLDQVDAALGKD
jgi:hypothetical protein